MGLMVGSISFWVSFIARIFILLHIPSCNVHWASKLKPLLTILSKCYNQTLYLAVLFSFIYLVLSLLGLIFGIWI